MKLKTIARTVLLITGTIVFLSAMALESSAQTTEPRSQRWTAGGALGFLGNTPGGTALALNFDAGIFLTPSFSVGPLLQAAFTGSLEQVGLSGQGKYWLDIPTTSNRAKITFQAGLGFVHANRSDSDTSFLIPLGVGLDYRLNDALAVYADFILNFTDLDTKPGRGRGHGDHHTNIMPGLTFGVRF